MSPRGMIEEEWVDIKIGNMQFAKKNVIEILNICEGRG